MSNLIKLRSPEGLEENHTSANATDLMNNAGWTAIGPAETAAPAPAEPEPEPEEANGGITDADTELLLTLSKLNKDDLIKYASEKFGVKIKATFSVSNIKAQIVGLTEAARTQLPPMNTADGDGDNDGDNGTNDGDNDGDNGTNDGDNDGDD